MTPDRFREITDRYKALKVAVVGDFCLDRYLEIDPTLEEVSIETGRPVHNVVRVRAQPGGAGTIVNNLAALGIGAISIVGFCGEDGEGYELRRALGSIPGVKLDHFVTTPERVTFTYCKPLVIRGGGPPVELDRLDSKNWSPTPSALNERLARAFRETAVIADAVILLEQVDRDGTGVVTPLVRAAAGTFAAANPSVPVLADSRRGLSDWPALQFKMNAAELGALLGRSVDLSLDDACHAVALHATRLQRSVFVTLAERGIVGAEPGGPAIHEPALPLRGPIDVVGAGDSVTANLATALAAGADLGEALKLAMLASSVVVHQVGTTGTAKVADLAELLVSGRA